MKLNFNKFKKVHADKHSTTLMHPSGHKIVIAHASLSPENKSDLDKFPKSQNFDEGGAVDKSPYTDPKSAADASQGASAPGWSEAVTHGWQNFKDAMDPSKAEKDPPQKQQKPKNYVDGGEVEPNSSSQEDSPDQIAQDAGAPQDQQSDAPPPVVVNVNGAQAAPQAQAPGQPPMPEQQQQAPQGDQMSQLQNAQRSANQVAGPNAQGAAVAPQQPLAPPNSMHAYEQQIRGQQGEAVAQADLAKQQAAAYAQDQVKQQTINDELTKSKEDMDKEFHTHMDDMKKGFIDPNRYYKSLGKSGRAISAIKVGLGALGAAMTGGPNYALDMLKDNINRDVEAQKTNAGITHNMYSAWRQKYGDDRQATIMTSLMGAKILQDQIQSQIATAQSPIIAERLKILNGQLEQNYAPMYQEMQWRQALQNMGSNGNASHIDPSTFVPQVVPKDHQKEVFAEIKTAQNAAKNKDMLMKNFDDAANENTVAKTGFLRTPASIMSMNAMELPIIHDAEGRVNEFEQKTLADLHPKPGDLDSKIAAKRQAYEAFIDQKMAAPTAKGYGIDLQKFSNTSSNQETRFSPEHKQFAQWARQNPQDPRAEVVLKKLGVK